MNFFKENKKIVIISLVIIIGFICNSIAHHYHMKNFKIRIEQEYQEAIHLLDQDFVSEEDAKKAHELLFIHGYHLDDKDEQAVVDSYKDGYYMLVYARAWTDFHGRYLRTKYEQYDSAVGVIGNIPDDYNGVLAQRVKFTKRFMIVERDSAKAVIDEVNAAEKEEMEKRKNNYYKTHNKITK